MEGSEDFHVLELGAAEDLQSGSSIDATANVTERKLQQTSVQAFINSYEGAGGRFTDAPPMGISGPTTHLPQVAHAPVESGGAGGVVYGGGAGAGTPGIAGGTMPLLGTLKQFWCFSYSQCFLPDPTFTLSSVQPASQG
jgi:hypothetical protein